MYSLNLEFSCNGQKIQIRILIIETLSTQLFGDVEFSFPFCFTKTINFILVKVFLSFCLCRISLFSLFFFIFFLKYIIYIYILDFETWILLLKLEIFIFENLWRFLSPFSFLCLELWITYFAFFFSFFIFWKNSLLMKLIAQILEKILKNFRNNFSFPFFYFFFHLLFIYLFIYLSWNFLLNHLSSLHFMGRDMIHQLSGMIRRDFFKPI